MFGCGLVLMLLVWLALAGLAQLLGLADRMNWVGWLIVPPAGIGGVLLGRAYFARRGRS
ncbi:hypothetical protein ACIF6L_28415 [Kitasatospora sp. NPDC086009]|uniref:hypothetical protein n=1 Tax=unclassified Kitasatospora TaxID=2633591 RepID=UPI0036B1E689